MSTNLFRLKPALHRAVEGHGEPILDAGAAVGIFVNVSRPSSFWPLKLNGQ
jgi:hypothetical protein